MITTALAWHNVVFQQPDKTSRPLIIGMWKTFLHFILQIPMNYKLLQIHYQKEMFDQYNKGGKLAKADTDQGKIVTK